MENYTVEGNRGVEITKIESAGESKVKTSAKVIENTGQVILNKENSKQLKDEARRSENKYNSPLKQLIRFHFTLNEKPKKGLDSDSPHR